MEYEFIGRADGANVDATTGIAPTQAIKQQAPHNGPDIAFL